MTEDYLSRHRAHDYPHLVARWRAVSERAGLTMRRIASSPDYELYTVRTKNLPPNGAIYISAGIHGDEPAGTEALITWAENNVRTLRRRPFFLVPCINPWGLVNNCRTDAKQRDLNRSFHDDAVPEIAALRRAIGSRRFSLGMTLHEDYDGVGIYIYEVLGTTPYWGEALLAAARPHVPADTRAVIEGRECVGGMVRPAIDMEFFKKIGLPEALLLHLLKCPRVFTVETPSEYSLERRIKAHVAVIEAAISKVG